MKINKGLAPLLQIDEQRMLVYTKSKIAIFDLYNDCLLEELRLPRPFFEGMASRNRLISRLLRLDPRTCEMVNDSIFLIAYRGRVYRVDFENSTVCFEQKFVDGMNAPLMFTKIENIQGVDDGIYYGEYLGNNEKNEVSIYRRDLEGHWAIAFSFPPGVVHHVHAIFSFENVQKVYVLTGDDDEGSAIWEVCSNFKELNVLLAGNQRYRACLCNLTERSLEYLTDTPMDRNYVFRYEQDRTGKLFEKSKYELGGPVIYGEYCGERLLCSTTVEPNSYFDSFKFFKYWFEKDIGAGIVDNYVHVYLGDNENGYTEVLKAEKDAFPMRLFQFGAIRFPKYSFSRFGQIHMYGIAIKNYDDIWVRM